MSYKTLEELREQEIRELASDGERVIISGFGAFPKNRQDLIDEGQADDVTATTIAHHNLWALVEDDDGCRYVRRAGVIEMIDSCIIGQWYTEIDGHSAYDVPASVRHAMGMRDELADDSWRRTLDEFWNTLNRAARTLR